MKAPAIKSGLKPLVGENPRILILGSLPGDESLRQQQYYAHKQNQFWRILSAIYGHDLTADYEDRVAIIVRNRLAVWDVLKSADRDGSLDSAIKTAVPNRFAPFLEHLPDIEAVGFNGQTAHALFKKYAVPDFGARFNCLRTAILPSTSPAATRPFDEKVALWRNFLMARRSA